MDTNPSPTFAGIASDPASLLTLYSDTRRITERLCAPLATEDYVVQAMPDVSPAKWHLAHVTWFFETFILERHLPGYETFNPEFKLLFNSYYNSAGPQYFRPHRGHLSRPTVEEVYEYRTHVDRAVSGLVELTGPQQLPEIGTLMAVGANHEQQHQELLLTDIKYNLGVNPLRPAYHARELPRGQKAPLLRWIELDGGEHEIGHQGDGFAFDNEGPRHAVHLRPYRLASRPVTNGEFIEFMEDEGYQRWDLWLSQGWETVRAQQWTAPLYWERRGDTWWTQTLSGMSRIDNHAPVTHVSYYEADAYARWSGRRLPTEHEWEHAAEGVRMQGNLQESGLYQPVPADGNGHAIKQMIGDVWEWTQSPYTPYPGFQPWEGDLGEYNGKFMVNQMVLRGGSCVTPRSHIRISYRNFFPPDARWQFSGLRLADDG